MSNYTISGSSPGMHIGQMAQIDIGPYDHSYDHSNKLPNKKISFDVHTAQGGYVIKVGKSFGIEDDLYVISDSQDLGQELGKIVTHYTLTKS